jgi:hypothetical protein
MNRDEVQRALEREYPKELRDAGIGGRMIRFSPALNKDRRVPVWITMPITFSTRRGGKGQQAPFPGLLS